MDSQERQRPPISIILAVYNEAENIVEVLDGVCRNLPPAAEVIVVDDDSPDGTGRLAAAVGDRRIRLVRRIGTRGLASAINRGLIESRGGLVGWMDADGSMPAGLLPEMIEACSRADVVVGSRYVEGGGDDRPRFRVLTSRWINGLARLCLGGEIRDYDSGFLVLRREVLDRVTLLPLGHGAYCIDFLYACRRRGLRVVEIPYRLSDRRLGRSKSAATPLRFLWTGLGYLVQIVLTRIRPLD